MSKRHSDGLMVELTIRLQNNCSSLDTNSHRDINIGMSPIINENIGNTWFIVFHFPAAVLHFTIFVLLEITARYV